jgi:hypothetical protein
LLRLADAMLERTERRVALARRYFSTASMNKLLEPSQEALTQVLLKLQSAEDFSGLRDRIYTGSATRSNRNGRGIPPSDHLSPRE